MVLTRWFRVFGMVAIALMTTLSLTAQGDLTAIQKQLNAQFKITSITGDRTDIVIPGDVVELHKDGLMLVGVAAALPTSNTYSSKDGKIKQGWGGFGKAMLSASMAGMVDPDQVTGAGSAPSHRLNTGEKCWVLAATAQPDGILFKLYTDANEDGMRFYANLKIPYANKKAVPPPDVALQTVAEVLTVDSDASPQAPPPAQVQAPPPPPLPEIAPPPPPVDAAPPPTSALGQTIDHVVADFGQPVSKTKVGVKVIYKYTDMKVTFTNGKVTDVE